MSTKLQYVGWSTFIFEDSKGFRMITDPFTEGNKDYKILPSPIETKDINVDLIICSHCSDDHFSQSFEIMDFNPKSKLVGDLATCALAKRAGYGNIFGNRVELITAGASYSVSNFTVHATSARHIAFRELPDGSYITGEPLCYAIQIKDGPTCFFGGDTALTYDMILWKELFEPEIAFLGIGGADLSGRTLSEMHPRAAAICAKMLGIKTVIPMHYNYDRDVTEFKRYISEIYPECKVLVMKPADIIEI